MSGLDQTEVDRQIQQMVAFIEQEAKEKADEISVKVRLPFLLPWYIARLVQSQIPGAGFTVFRDRNVCPASPVATAVLLQCHRLDLVLLALRQDASQIQKKNAARTPTWQFPPVSILAITAPR